MKGFENHKNHLTAKVGDLSVKFYKKSHTVVIRRNEEVLMEATKINLHELQAIIDVL